MDQGKLLFDLPKESLSGEELSRAIILGRKFGFVEYNRGFQLWMGTNVKSGARLILLMFMKVYLLPTHFTLEVEAS